MESGEKTGKLLPEILKGITCMGVVFGYALFHGKFEDVILILV